MKILYEKDLRTKFKQLFAKINILLGGNIETLPKDEEMEVMLNYALDNWSGMTLTEIEMAVNANISRKTADFVQYFGKISVSYLQSCIVNYQEVKRKAILDEKRRQDSERPKTLNEPDYIVNSKLYDGLVQFIQSQGKFPDYWDFGRVYEHMKENNLLIEWSLGRKKEEFERVKEALSKWKTESKIMAGSISQRNEAEGIDDHKKIIAECQRLHILATLIQ